MQGGHDDPNTILDAEDIKLFLSAIKIFRIIFQKSSSFNRPLWKRNVSDFTSSNISSIVRQRIRLNPRISTRNKYLLKNKTKHTACILYCTFLIVYVEQDLYCKSVCEKYQ